MNFLAHTYLAGSGDGDRLGALLGDFVKGPLDRAAGGLSREIISGIALHRHIDSYLDGLPAFRRSRARLTTVRRLVTGIAVDVFYDHFLARHWDHFCNEPLESYAQEIYDLLDAYAALLPARLERLRHAMRAGDWLVSYRRVEVVSTALERMANRLSRPALLAGAGRELTNHYEALEDDFFEVMAQLEEDVARWRQGAQVS